MEEPRVSSIYDGYRRRMDEGSIRSGETRSGWPRTTITLDEAEYRRLNSLRIRKLMQKPPRKFRIIDRRHYISRDTSYITSGETKSGWPRTKKVISMKEYRELNSLAREAANL
jgi:hypothetical protein